MLTINFYGNNVELDSKIPQESASAVEKLIDVLISKGVIVELRLPDPDIEDPKVLPVLNFQYGDDSYSVPSRKIDDVLKELCSIVDVQSDLAEEDKSNKNNVAADAGAMKKLFKLLSLGFLAAGGVAAGKDLTNSSSNLGVLSKNTDSALGETKYDFLTQANLSSRNLLNNTDDDLDSNNVTTNAEDEEFDGYTLTINTSKMKEYDEGKGKRKGRKLSELGQLVTSYEDNNVTYEIRQISEDEKKELDKSDNEFKNCFKTNKNTYIHAIRDASSKKNKKRNKKKGENNSNDFRAQDLIDAIPGNGVFDIGPEDLPAEGSKYEVWVAGLDTGVNNMTQVFGNRLTEGFSAYPIHTDLKLTGIGDGNGHGSHTGDLAAGEVSGFARKAKFIPIRVLDSTGSGSLNGYLRGMHWFINEFKKAKKNGRKILPIVNQSLQTSYNEEMNNAVKLASDNGIVVVSAAGNYGKDACNTSPAGASRIAKGAVTVGSVNNNMIVSWFSNTGPCVTVYAPGEKVPAAVNEVNGKLLKVAKSGTSQAAPLFAGIIANIWGKNPKLTSDEVIKLAISYTKQKNGLRIAQMQPRN